jgi:hypothetical protein
LENKMHNIIAAIKAHPFYLVGGVIAILLLIQLTSKRKAATPSASSAFVVGADPAALAANTQMTLAQDA